MIYAIVAVIIAAVVYVLSMGVDKRSRRLIMPGAVSQWIDQANEASRETGVPVDLILATIWVESVGDPQAVGSAGEKGLMQIKQIAADDVRQNMGVDVAGYDLSPSKNIKVGSYFLALQYKRTGSWPDAVKAYNQGYAGMQNNQGKALDYLNKVNAKRAKLA